MHTLPTVRRSELMKARIQIQPVKNDQPQRIPHIQSMLKRELKYTLTSTTAVP